MSFSANSNSNPNVVAIGNFNKDKYLDLAVTTFGTKKIETFLRNGNESLRVRGEGETSSHNLDFTSATKIIRWHRIYMIILITRSNYNCSSQWRRTV